MIIKKAVYKTSVVNKNNIIDDGVPEFAFVGRSNVGKSSLINSIVKVKGLAKTSATPGKTKMINYFDINDSFRIVDLPGYGFAKVGKGQLDVWSSILGDYLTESKSLVNVFVLLDIRHKPTEQDRQMIKFLIYFNIPFSIIVTKADKLAKSKIKQSVSAIAKELSLREEIFLASSSENGLGREEILRVIENKLEYFSANRQD